jgi:nicotinamide-nucleotide amidase
MGGIEIITIGDELVEGRLVDTNAATLSERLLAEGLPVARHMSVGDDRHEIVAALREATSRRHAVLVSGGLGPTSDDITAECAAEAFDVSLVRSPEALRHVREFFASRGREMSPNNEKQADLPDGAVILPNPRGTAVGFRLSSDGCHLYFMPGVPRELVEMFDDSVLPHLRTFLAGVPRHVSQLKVFGLGESDVARHLEGLADDLPANVRLTVQYRASFPEIHVRLVLESAEQRRAEELLGGLTAEARRRLEKVVFATGGDRVETSFPEQVVAELRSAKLTLAAADGGTGGVLGQLVTAASNSADVLLGCILAPCPRTLGRLVGVATESIDLHGDEVARVAEETAAAVRDRFGADLGLSVLGSPESGPELLDGRLTVAVDTGDERRVRQYTFPLEQDRFRLLAAYVALGRVRRALRSANRG